MRGLAQPLRLTHSPEPPGAREPLTLLPATTGRTDVVLALFFCNHVVNLITCAATMAYSE